MWDCRWRWVWGRGQAHNRQPDEGAPQQQPPPQVSVPILAVGGGSAPAASNPGDQLLSNTPHNFPNMHSEPLASMQVRPFPRAKSLLPACQKKPRHAKNELGSTTPLVGVWNCRLEAAVC